MRKKAISLLLAASMLASSFTVPVFAAEKDDLEEITYAFATFTSVPADVQSVADAINEITEEKIGVHVNLLVLDPSNYSQQIALMIASGQDLDMFHTLGDLNQYVAGNQVLPLDSLLEEYGQDIISIEPDFFMEAGKIKDETYGIPFYMGKALAPTVLYRQDILDELGIDGKSISSFEDLDEVYAKVHEAHPELKILSPLNSGDCGVQYLVNHIDYLTDSYHAPTGVLIGDGTEVVNYYETEEFKTIVEWAHDWYEKGYISADAATTTMLASAEVSSGTAFSAIGAYSGEIPETQFAAPQGGTLGSARLSDVEISTSDVNTLSRVISVNSKHPEAAMKFLNLSYTEPAISTLLSFGIEGRDYVKEDDTYITYPEGQNMFTVSYNAFLSAAVSNAFHEGPILQGQSQEDLELQKEENETAWRSKAFGFTFDSTPVKTQYSSVNNVINHYLPGMVCGALDPDTELETFQQALKDAGIEDIIAEKQKQLDAWMAEQ